MTNEEAIAIIQNEYKCVDRDCDIERSCGKCNLMTPNKEPILEAYKLAIKALEQQPCEMTTEEYRQRMIQAFHNADTDELIAVCVLPTEKEFEHLEWLLKNHYKKAPCVDAISRQAVDKLSKELVHTTRDKADFLCNFWEGLQQLPSVTQKYGKWIYQKGYVPYKWKCNQCSAVFKTDFLYCPNCGCRMVEPQERSE